jgi:hypothetical protein
LESNVTPVPVVKLTAPAPFLVILTKEPSTKATPDVLGIVQILALELVNSRVFAKSVKARVLAVVASTTMAPDKTGTLAIEICAVVDLRRVQSVLVE